VKRLILSGDKPKERDIVNNKTELTPKIDPRLKIVKEESNNTSYGSPPKKVSNPLSPLKHKGQEKAADHLAKQLLSNSLVSDSSNNNNEVYVSIESLQKLSIKKKSKTNNVPLTKGTKNALTKIKLITSKNIKTNNSSTY